MGREEFRTLYWAAGWIMALKRYTPVPTPVQVVTPTPESTARQRVVLPTDGLLSDVCQTLDIPFNSIPGHACVYSKIDFHGTCDKIVGAGGRQIYGDPFSAHYELGRIIKVHKDKVLVKDGIGVKYVERVTIY